jgi:hypothetical protein
MPPGSLSEVTGRILWNFRVSGRMSDMQVTLRRWGLDLPRARGVPAGDAVLLAELCVQPVLCRFSG